MNKFKKSTAAALLIVFAVIAASGCGRQFDSSGYIKGMLDSTYKGNFEKHSQDTNTDEKALSKDYEQLMAHEAGVFLQFCGLKDDETIPEDTRSEILSLIKDIFEKAQYEVHEADSEGSVSIVVLPIDIYSSTYEAMSQFNTEFKERNTNYEFADYTDDDFIKAYLDPIIELFRTQMESMPYLEPVTVSVLVAPDTAGRYGITNNEITNIHNSIINYTISP